MKTALRSSRRSTVSQRVRRSLLGVPVEHISTAVTITGGSPVLVTVPAHLSGDVIVLSITMGGNGSLLTNIDGGTGGWVIHEGNDADDVLYYSHTVLATKIATSDSAATTTTLTSSSGETYNVMCSIYRNVGLIGPTAFAKSTPGILNIPSLSVTGPGLVVGTSGVGWSTAGNRFFTTPEGWTMRGETGSGGNGDLVACLQDFAMTAAGDTPSVDFGPAGITSTNAKFVASIMLYSDS